MGTKTSKVRNSQSILEVINGFKRANRLAKINKILSVNEPQTSANQQLNGFGSAFTPSQNQPSYLHNTFPNLNHQQFIPQQQPFYSSNPVDVQSVNLSLQPLLFSPQISQQIYQPIQQQFPSILSQPFQPQYQQSLYSKNFSIANDPSTIQYNQYSQHNMIPNQNQFSTLQLPHSSDPNQQFISITKNYAKVSPSVSSFPYQTQAQPQSHSAYQAHNLPTQQYTQIQPKISSIHVYSKIPSIAPRLNKTNTQVIPTYTQAASQVNQHQLPPLATHRRPQLSQPQQERNLRPSQVQILNQPNRKSMPNRNQSQYDSFTSLSEFSDYSRNDYC